MMRVSMPKVHMPKPKGVKIQEPMRVHPSVRNARMRLPQGIANTSDAAPAPYIPGVGKL